MFRNRKRLLMCFLSSLILLTSCHNSEENNDLSNSQKEFFDSSRVILENVQNNHNLDDLPFNYFVYTMDDGYITDLMGFDYDVSNYNLDNGIIIVNNKKEFYMSLEGNGYCAVKGYTDENIKVYSISQKSKCHKLYTSDNEEPEVKVSAMLLSDKSQYKIGSNAKEDVYLEAITNILDERSYTYKWYRNGEEIKDSNVYLYQVISEYENAEYYVEMITNDGNVYKSVPMTIKINKNQN